MGLGPENQVIESNFIAKPAKSPLATYFGIRYTAPALASAVIG